MGQEGSSSWPPVGSPLNLQREEHWRHFDNSVNAVSFGFVATAILISMFLVMAIVERFLRPTSPPDSRAHAGDLESQTGKLGLQSPKMTFYSNGVSVLMPGEDIPTFIAKPAPVSCPPGCIFCPHHHHVSFPNTNNSNSTSMQES
ncbi:uncharacterized protein LOC110817914 [Carica papaya]|uniref:uncharacterized protein LOC110817914 n=1 Tax=Carica papaya TaxID=3649 RepID=UPI000B8C71F6|nr:uncharacterized protein LOC110817914 [Carica papaya]